MDNVFQILNSYNKKSEDKNLPPKEFKFPTKKKFSHQTNLDNTKESNKNKKMYAITEILVPSKNKHSDSEFNLFDNDDVSKDDNGKENGQKSIKWRSPLVFSPAVKFSPKICFKNISVRRDDENDTHNDITNETFETSASSKSTVNLTMNILRTPNKPSPSTSSVFKSRGTKFPLCDRDYDSSPDKNKTTHNLKEEISDICSTSFLDNLGFTKTSQYKPTPRQSKKFERSATVDYYSQLLSQPIQAQKSRNDLHSKDNPKDKLNDLKNNFEQNKENMHNYTQNAPDKEHFDTQICPEQSQDLRAIRKTQTANTSVQNNTLPSLPRESFNEIQESNFENNFILSQERGSIQGPNFKYKPWSTLDNTIDNVPTSECFDRRSGEYPEQKTFHKLSRCQRLEAHPQYLDMTDRKQESYYYSEPNFSRPNYNSAYPQNLNESTRVCGNYSTNRATQSCQCHRTICDNKNQNMTLRPIHGNNYHKHMDLNQSRFLNDTFAEDVCFNQSRHSSKYFNLPKDDNRFYENYNHRFAQEYQMLPQRNAACSKYENNSQYFLQPSHTQSAKYQRNYPPNEAHNQSHQSNEPQISFANEGVRNDLYDMHQKRNIRNENTQVDEGPIYPYQKENDVENLQQASTSQICSQRSDGIHESYFQKSANISSNEYISDQDYTRTVPQRRHQGFVDHHSFQNSFNEDIFHYPHSKNQANVRQSTMNLNFNERTNDSLISKMLKKPASFEENSNFNQRNTRSFQEQDQNDDVYRQNMVHPDLNNSFLLREFDYPNWDACEQSFSCERPSALVKSSAVPPTGRYYQNCYFSPNGEVYPPVNDKEYVMNKFFRSLSNE